MFSANTDGDEIDNEHWDPSQALIPVEVVTMTSLLQKKETLASSARDSHRTKPVMASDTPYMFG